MTTPTDPTHETSEPDRFWTTVNALEARAAELLGISRQALYRRIEKYGISLGHQSDAS